MRKKAWKKNIAILLVIAMMLTIMPMTVFAEGETEENDATSESVQSFLLNEAQGEVEVEAGVPFNVVVEATTDSAVKVQWTIGNNTNETEDLVVVEEQKTSTIAFENGLTEITVITATFLDETGNAIADGDPVSATFTVKENVAPAKTITVNANAEGEATYKTIQEAIDYIDSQEDKTGWTINVAAGEYDRFTIPYGLEGLTIIGESKDTVTVNTLKNLERTRCDNGGINAYGSNTVLRNMTIEAGDQVVKTANGSTLDAAISTHHSDKGGSGVSLTVENCTLIGPGVDKGTVHGIFWDCTRVEVKDCNISGFSNAIEYMNDNYNVPSDETYYITGNNIIDCSFAIHGYFGKGNGGGILEISNNTVKGTSDLRAKVIVQDIAYDSNSLKVDIKNNVFTNVMVGLVNMRDEGKNLSDILTENTVDENSCYVEAIEPGTIEFYSSYQATMNKGWKNHWVLNENSINSIPSENRELIQQALTEGQAYKNKLNISGLADGTLITTFTSFKDGIYLVPEEAGSLTIAKEVECDYHDTHDAQFNFKVTFKDADGNEMINVPMHYGESDEEAVCSGDIVTVKSGESITLRDVPVGTSYTVEEVSVPMNYAAQTEAQSGSIDEQFEEDTVQFVNRHLTVEIPPLEIDKTATDLENDKTTVTLKVGSGETKTASDVVFVLDKSTSVNVRKEAIAMLGALKEQAKDNVIKVGVVVFDLKVRNELPLTELNNQNFETIASFINSEKVESGTNVQAGLAAGRAMLDADDLVKANAKHLVLITDGVTYLWGTGETPMSIYSEQADNGCESINAGNDFMGKHHLEESYIDEFADIAKWMNDYSNYATDIAKYEDVYESGQYSPENGKYHMTESVYTQKKYVPAEELTTTACANDGAVYEAVNEFNASVLAGYHCYAYASMKYQDAHPWGYRWVASLNKLGDNVVSTTIPLSVEGMFNNVKSDIIYTIDHATVTDVIGNNFDLEDLKTMNLTVGGEVVKPTEVKDNVVYFGNQGANGVYPYVVTYSKENADANGVTKETLVWDINVQVEQAKGLALSYELHLVNKSTVAGKHTEETNESAIIKYVPTGSDKEKEQEFEKPTVSYTVEKTEPGPGPGPGPGNNDVTRNVTKVWKDDATANRPDSITVNILYDGSVHQKVTLNAANDWTYAWKTSGGGWTVEEANVPAGYTSSVSTSGNDFIITNTYTGIIPEEPITDPDVPTTKPDVPPVVIDEPGVPTTDVPGTPVNPTEIAEPEVPLGDAPKTGDAAPMVVFVGLMAAAVVGLVITRRKFN